MHLHEKTFRISQIFIVVYPCIFIHPYTCTCIKLISLPPSPLSNHHVASRFPDTHERAQIKSQEAIEELNRGQELLKEEVNKLRTQMNLVVQVLLRRQGNPPSCQLHAYPSPQIPQPQAIPHTSTSATSILAEHVCPSEEKTKVTLLL